MIREYHLKKGRETLQFAWDAERGTVTGRDAILVLNSALFAQRQGYACIPPFPSTCDIVNPLKNISEMAAVLIEMGVELDDELSKALPSEVLDDDEGVVY